MRRSLPPRPTFAPESAEEPGHASTAAAARSMNRPARLVEREAPYLVQELKRIATVTATCVGLLVLLTVVDRLR